MWLCDDYFSHCLCGKQSLTKENSNTCNEGDDDDDDDDDGGGDGGGGGDDDDDDDDDDAVFTLRFCLHRSLTDWQKKLSAILKNNRSILLFVTASTKKL